MLPFPVLEKAQAELCDYQDTGCSVMEMSHRSSTYQKIYDAAEASLRRLLALLDDYCVLFLQGGATLQFSMTAMNLARRNQKAAYALTGVFAEKAFNEASRWCGAYQITNAEGRCTVPEIDPAALLDNTAYLHITGNNTACGTMYKKTPPHGDVPLVADWSSGILASVIPVTDYDLIYAGAQKNIGPAGVTVVIARRSLFEREPDPLVPSLMRYDTMDKTGSMLNTPPTYGIYICGLVFEWLEAFGGIEAIERVTREKSGMIYQAIDSTDFYEGIANPACRSLTNVTFRLRDQSLTPAFLEEAAAERMIGLKGYRLIGGIRASVYNGMPKEGAEALADFMAGFAKRHG